MRSIATKRRASMIEYLQVLVLSNCILTVTQTHTHNRHFRSIYELKYWHKGKYRALKKFTSKNGGGGPRPGGPPKSAPDTTALLVVFF